MCFLLVGFGDPSGGLDGPSGGLGGPSGGLGGGWMVIPVAVF